MVASKEKPFVNLLGMKFVPVPINDGPTKGQRVLFGIWEVRVQDYQAFAEGTNREWSKPSFAQSALHPAVNVSWQDAQAFCDWLTERERTAGQIGARDSYRLPSDHEWSCAAEIGSREDAAKAPALKDQVADIFAWGNRWPPVGNFSGQETVGNSASSSQVALAGFKDEFVQTAPVGSFAANRFGLFDLGGNVWEWCEEWLDAQQQARVLRGASWHDGTRDRLLASRRGSDPEGNRNAWNGFRCVLSLAK